MTSLSPPVGRLVLYTKRMEEMTAFYCLHFGYEAHTLPGDRIVELRPPGPGPALLLHPAGKGQREGQALVKLVFDVEDVVGFRAMAVERGLHFGPIHGADGYAFANARDPSKNSISISSRAFAIPVPHP